MPTYGNENFKESNVNYLNKDFSEFSNIKAYGGTIEGLGPVISGNNLYINSGYQYGGNMPGNVLISFEIKD